MQNLNCSYSSKKTVDQVLLNNILILALHHHGIIRAGIGERAN